MPIKQHSKKALRQNIKRASRNMKVREDIKTLLKKIRKAVDAKQDKAKIEAMIKDVQKKLDKAAQKNIFKKNTVARKLSRLVKYSKKGIQAAVKEAGKKTE
ncbi:MAG: 30S ribosomal protein S20 [Candidatus Parcubacteria bacterium]|nr:30S ribosomal protein S20 [Candidatus Parcubacteria bacterium]